VSVTKWRRRSAGSRSRVTSHQPALREELPDPTPGDNEILVRVHASSVNPVDNSIAAGMLAQMGVEYEYPVVLGRDYAGVVEHVGGAVSISAPATTSSASCCMPTRPRTTAPGPS
jgi:NADPH:quinone reductase-like Zn-dependent oxidoreductase